MSNPVLRPSAFSSEHASSGVMTVNGAIQKSALLLAICGGAAYLSWGSSTNLALGAALVGFILCIIISFRPAAAPMLAPVYAVAEGIFLGAISSFFEGAVKGIVMQAVMLTGGVFFAMLAAYQTRLIRPTGKFVGMVIGATLGIAVFYALKVVLMWCGVDLTFLNSGGLGIGISLFICGIAALNLILDFAMIEYGAEGGAPKHMEWYCAFGLLVTLVWLYLEILRLLMRRK